MTFSKKTIKKNHFIKLLDSGGQEFRQDKEGETCLCSMTSGNSAGICWYLESGIV